MKRARVLWFVEHRAREFDVACAVKCLAESRHPVDVQVRNIYLHAREVLAGPPPRIVAYPFFYFADGALGTQHYVKAWPRALHVNLAWEELFYASNARIKGPSDEFARSRVLHHAWGSFYRTFLEQHGVPARNIFVNGNPAYQLYRPPYSRIAPPRSELARRHGLDPHARWVFIPENYRWAFAGEHKLKKIAASEDHLQELLGMKVHCVESLAALMKWCDTVARGGGVEVILRPRPAINTRHMLDFLERTVGEAAPGFRVIKDGSVREWILASDVVESSFSTSLIEAAVANKPVFMIEPLPLPAGLHSDWYEHVDRLRTLDDFALAASPAGSGGSPERLRLWAERELLARGDPIAGLADLLGRLADPEQRLAPALPAPGFFERRREERESRKARDEGATAIDMNRDTHEGDEFHEADVVERVEAWRGVLLGSAI